MAIMLSNRLAPMSIENSLKKPPGKARTAAKLNTWRGLATPHGGFLGEFFPRTSNSRHWWNPPIVPALLTTGTPSGSTPQGASYIVESHNPAGYRGDFFMDGFEIRLASNSDARFIAAISRDHIEFGLGWQYRQAEILEKIRDPDTNVIVARRGTELAGFAIMHYAGFEAHLILFGVAPAWRRRGAGTALIRWLITTAEVSGAFVIYVELRRNNAIARSFYRSLGFRRMEQLPGYYRGSEDGLRMALDLRRGNSVPLPDVQP